MWPMNDPRTTIQALPPSWSWRRGGAPGATTGRAVAVTASPSTGCAGHAQSGHGDDVALDLAGPAAEGEDDVVAVLVLEHALQLGAGRSRREVAHLAHDLEQQPPVVERGLRGE